MHNRTISGSTKDDFIHKLPYTIFCQTAETLYTYLILSCVGSDFSNIFLKSKPVSFSVEIIFLILIFIQLIAENRCLKCAELCGNRNTFYVNWAIKRNIWEKARFLIVKNDCIF